MRVRRRRAIGQIAALLLGAVIAAGITALFMATTFDVKFDSSAEIGLNNPNNNNNQPRAAQGLGGLGGLDQSLRSRRQLIRDDSAGNNQNLEHNSKMSGDTFLSNSDNGDSAGERDFDAEVGGVLSGDANFDVEEDDGVPQRYKDFEKEAPKKEAPKVKNVDTDGTPQKINDGQPQKKINPGQRLKDGPDWTPDPSSIEIVSLDKPRALLYRHFLSEEECDYMINYSSSHLSRSG